MRRLRMVFFLTTCILLSYNITAQNTSKADKIIGTYVASDNEHPDNVSHIKIYKSSDGKFHGEIIWLKKPHYPDGKEKVDRLNPDQKLRNRKLIGLRMLNDFKFDSDKGEWNSGTIYNPASGKTYHAFITFKGPDKLHVRGYIGKAWMGLGKTVEWTRLK